MQKIPLNLDRPHAQVPHHLFLKPLEEHIPFIRVELDVYLRRHLIGQFEQLAAVGDKHEQTRIPFFNRNLGNRHLVINRFDGSAQVDLPDDN